MHEFFKKKQISLRDCRLEESGSSRRERAWRSLSGSSPRRRAELSTRLCASKCPSRNTAPSLFESSSEEPTISEKLAYLKSKIFWIINYFYQKKSFVLVLQNFFIQKLATFDLRVLISSVEQRTSFSTLPSILQALSTSSAHWFSAWNRTMSREKWRKDLWNQWNLKQLSASIFLLRVNKDMKL